MAFEYLYFPTFSDHKSTSLTLNALWLVGKEFFRVVKRAMAWKIEIK